MSKVLFFSTQQYNYDTIYCTAAVRTCVIPPFEPLLINIVHCCIESIERIPAGPGRCYDI
jgi:hypothetical protein